MNNYIEEFADLAPVGLEYYGTVGGFKIHSNDKITTYVSNWIKSSDISKLIGNKVLQLIQNKEIIIGYENKSKMSFIWKRMKRYMTPTRGGYAMGFFSKEDKKIVILLDDNTTFFGKAIRDIPPIINHETIHLATNKDTNFVLKNTIREYLLPFYSNIIHNIHGKVDGNALSKAIIELAKIFDHSSMPTEIEMARNVWKNYFQDVELANSMLSPFLYYHRKISKYSTIGQEVLRHYYKSYNDLGLKNPENFTLAGQEALFPSEILAILNQFNMKHNMAKVINTV